MTGADWLTLSAGSAVVFTVLLFARAALHKAADLTAFGGFVADYGLLPEALVRPAAFALLAAELLVVAGLLIPAATPYAATAAAGLLLLYAGAIAAAVRSGRRWIECGCGGAVQPVSRALVLRNLLLAALALAGTAGSPADLAAGEAVAVVAAGFSLFLGYLLGDQILGNAAHAARAAAAAETNGRLKT